MVGGGEEGAREGERISSSPAHTVSRKRWFRALTREGFFFLDKLSQTIIMKTRVVISYERLRS